MISTSKPSVNQKIWGMLSPTDRRSLIFLLILIVVGMLLEMLGVGMVIPALAIFTQNDLTDQYPALYPIIQTMGNPSQKDLIIGGMLVLVSVYFLKNLFLAFLGWKQIRFAYGLQAQLSQRLFEVYLRQPYTFHLQRNSGQLINTVNEVNSFTSNAVIPVMTILTEGFVLLGLCALLIIIEPFGTLTVISILSLSTLGFHHFTRFNITRWGEQRFHHDGLRMQHMQQGLGGVKDAIILGREENFLEQYRIHNWRSIQMGQFQSGLQQLPRLWMELLAVSGLAILAITMISQGSASEAILPTLGLFAAAGFRLIPCANKILCSMQLLRFGLPVINTLYDEFNLIAPKNPVRENVIKPFHDTLQLNKVFYSYHGTNKAALKSISLSIKHGESIGFIGKSGAGKSTLVDILLGLLTPDNGEVKVDGINIQENIRSWQDQIGYVSQSIFLTDDTLRRNIAFGLPNEKINEVAILRAIKSAQLEEFVVSLPKGLDTIVGERGVRLSGGQRQRIGIARALYHDPAVLVMDEATSSLDSVTERDVIQAVNTLHGSKTIIFVAHRLSTVEKCDRIYKLERGELKAQGSLQEVFQK